MRRRHRSLRATGVIFVSGGEPLEGCDPVTLLVACESATEAERRATELGVWHAHAWDDMKIRQQDTELALTDARGFAWKPGHERNWQGSDSWPAFGSPPVVA